MQHRQTKKRPSIGSFPVEEHQRNAGALQSARLAASRVRASLKPRKPHTASGYAAAARRHRDADGHIDVHTHVQIKWTRSMNSGDHAGVVVSVHFHEHQPWWAFLGNCFQCSYLSSSFQYASLSMRFIIFVNSR